jgi:hypothetical protein
MSSSFVKVENNIVVEHIIADIDFIQSGAVGDPAVWHKVLADTAELGVSVGFSYDPALNLFIPPQPFSSWSWNAATREWSAPTPRPDDGQKYFWFEETQKWMPYDESLYTASIANTATSNAYLADAMKLVGDTIANS